MSTIVSILYILEQGFIFPSSLSKDKGRSRFIKNCM